MNRLVLIGNGFDLAHGLKTSYKDFIFWYLDECFNEAGAFRIGNIYEDEFVKICVHDIHLAMNLKYLSGSKGISKYLHQAGQLNNYINFNENSLKINDYYRDDYKNVSKISGHYITLKSVFFETLIDSCIECDWVDIEQEYFNALCNCKSSDGLFDYQKVNKLNKHFNFLKNKLEEYLTIQDRQFDNRLNFQLVKQLGQEFVIDDFDPSIADDDLRGKLGKDDSVLNVHKMYVLNFNYTNTFYNYIREVRCNTFSKIEINHIHGQLNDLGNPIIFGFGDEHDKDYAQFEEIGNNTLFEHVKSYHYLKTSNYRNLMRFLNEDYYQVYVVGHSCGLSDRTMFKEIFDHENCKSVKILHHKRADGTTDFFDKTINLGRHFTDKGRMRKLIVNFNEADAIPQFEKEIKDYEF